VIAVDHLARQRADQVFIDAALADQATRCAVGCSAAVMDLAGRKPAIRHDQAATAPRGFVGQHRRDHSHRSIGHGAPVGATPHTTFHRGHVEVFDHDLAIGARQFGGELVGGFPPQVHTPAIQLGQLGFRCPMTM